MVSAQSLACRTGEVYLTVLQLPRDPDGSRPLDGLLDAEERARADRYRHVSAREAFVVGRAALRILLGATLSSDPRQIRLDVDEAGKPSLASPPPRRQGHRLDFNVSHSGDLALIALAWDCPLGVDVEAERSLPDALKLAGRFFSPRERADLARLPAEELEAAFFRCWTRKEAYLKALGTGLAGGLERFAVSIEAGESARVLDIDGGGNAPRDWQLHDLATLPGYAAALAYRGVRRPLRRFPSMDLARFVAHLSSTPGIA